MGPRLRSVAGAFALALAGCGHDWQAYDPVGGGAASASDASTGAAGGGVGGGAGLSGSGASAGSTSAGGGASTGAGGSAASGGGDPAGLVAAYAFDEGSGATLADATANGNDGQIFGATWVAGKHGGALSFDGQGDHVRVPADPSWEDASSQFTIEAWVRVTAPGGYAGAVTIGPWTGQSGALLLHDATWSFNMVTVGGPNAYLCGTASPPLSYLEELDGQFHHVAGVLDLRAGACRLYLDGALVSEDTFVDGALDFGSSDLTIGGFDGSNYIAADIDDVRVYQRALSDAEIAADAAEPVGK
jgi:hypothetical protein